MQYKKPTFKMRASIGLANRAGVVVYATRPPHYE